jgi:hypothetical protein
MDPALSKRKSRCEPALVGTRPRAKVNDLDTAFVITDFDQIVDQLGQQSAQSGGASGGVGGDPRGKPAWIDGSSRCSR